MSSALLICNRHARKYTASKIAEVRDVLASYGSIDEIETTLHRGVADIVERLNPAVTRVYALGGDGTAGKVAGALTCTDIPLAIIPLGTTNVLARECRIPLHPIKAAHIMARSKRTHRFHTWSTGSGTLLLSLGVGLDAKVMARTTTTAKRRWGLFAVAAAAFRELIRYDFPPIEVTGEDARGQRFSAFAISVLVSNAQRYTGERIIMPGADPSDNLLDILISQPIMSYCVIRA